MSIELNIVISCIGIIGAGMSAYLGVKIALAEIKKDIFYLRKDIDRLERRRRVKDEDND